MINLVFVLVTIALVSLQQVSEANAQLEKRNINLDNNLQANVVPTPKRRIKKFVHISMPPPATVRHVPGTKNELTCEVMGRPAPTVQWLKNGEPMAEYDESNEIVPTNPTSLAQMTSKLVITSASQNGDVYTCVATAGAKQQTASSTVYSTADEEEVLTLEKLFRMPSKPIITSYYDDVFQDMGTELILPCQVFSFTKTQLFWQDKENNLIFENSRMRMLPSGDLLITDLRWSDMGNFTCTAKNMYGKEFVATFVYPTKPEV